MQGLLVYRVSTSNDFENLTYHFMVNDRFGDWVMRVIKRMDIFSVTAVHFKTYLFTTYFYSGHYGIGMVSKRMYFKVHFQVIHWHYTQ